MLPALLVPLAYVAGFGLAILVLTRFTAATDQQGILLSAAAADAAALAAVVCVRDRLRFGAGGVLPALLAALAIGGANLAGSPLLRELLPPSAMERTLETARGFVELGAAILLVAILAPLCEEGYFRGILYPRLRDRVGAPSAVLLVSLAFALLHPGRETFAIYVAISIALTLLAEATGGLAAPIAAHMALNSGSLALILWRGASGHPAGWSAIALLTAGTTVAYLAAGSRRLAAVRRAGEKFEALTAALYALGGLLLASALAASAMKCFD